MNTADARLTATLAEYSALKAEIGARTGYQHQIIQLHITVLTALTGAVFSAHFGRWAALAIPIEAALFGLWYLDHALTIAEISGYIQSWSEGRIAAEASARELLNWESRYGLAPSTVAVLRIFLFRLVVAVTFFGPAVAGLAWLFLDRGAPAEPNNATTDGTFESVMVTVAIGLVGLLVVSFGCLVRIQYSQNRRNKKRISESVA
jgi:hypothetical protein